MLERFEEEIGQQIDFRKCGYLFLLTREEDLRVFRNNLKMQQRLGVQTEWLSGDEIRRWLPIMELDNVLGGTFNAGDGLVDPNGVVMGYISAGQKSGLQAFSGLEVTGISVKHNRVAGLTTSAGPISTPLVVNAAGPWAGITGLMAGV